MEVGATCKWWDRWGESYLHDGYEKMFVLFFSDKARCLTDKQVENMTTWTEEEKQRHKDEDRSTGRMEIRLFDHCYANGEKNKGFLNVGKGNEGLPKAKPSWSVVYVARKKKGSLLERLERLIE